MFLDAAAKFGWTIGATWTVACDLNTRVAAVHLKQLVLPVDKGSISH